MFELSAARYSEAVVDLQWALEQAPLSGDLDTTLARALACAGRYEEAQPIIDRYGEDDSGVLLFTGRVLLHQGAGVGALPYLERAVELSNRAPVPLATLAYAYASVGRDQDARALLPELEASDFWIPGVYAELGDAQRALDELERGYEGGLPDILGLRCFGQAGFTDLTKHDVLAGEPRMEDFLRRMDFPD